MSLTNRDIYTSALSLIGEAVSSINVEDYEERAPYLIASFCSANASLDKRIRKREGLGAPTRFSPVYLALEKDFPMCDSLSGAASLYCAAMLVIDEDAALSDSLYDKYCDAVSSLSLEYSPGSEMSECGSIVEKYFFN